MAKYNVGICKNEHCGTRQNKSTGGWFHTLSNPLEFLIVDFLEWRVKGYCSEKCMDTGERNFNKREYLKMTELEEENKRVKEIKDVLISSMEQFDGDGLIVYAMFDVMKELFVDEDAEELRPRHQFINEVFMETMSGLFD
ncbi:MAG: hypothetical protein GQ547_03805 [Methylophaga sp.]|nr:hypothetical protein [Methylophaga sp.]